MPHPPVLQKRKRPIFGLDREQCVTIILQDGIEEKDRITGDVGKFHSGLQAWYVGTKLGALIYWEKRTNQDESSCLPAEEAFKRSAKRCADGKTEFTARPPAT